MPPAPHAPSFPKARPRMTKLIVFTDLHMTPEGISIIGLDPYRRLAAGIAHVNAYHGDTDRVIFTGDLTHRADAASYLRLKELLATLPAPATITIGNHDNRETFLAVFGDVTPDENGFVQQVIDLPDCRLVLLDTLFAPPYNYPMSHSGHLCERRLQWLDRSLAGAGGRPVLLFMHHPPHKTGFTGMDAIRLSNEDAFYEVVLRHGNVRHIFAGHVHRTIGGSHRGIPFSIFKSPVHQQPMPFDTPNPSLAVDEPGAYGIVVVTDEGLQVHTEDFEIARRDSDIA